MRDVEARLDGAKLPLTRAMRKFGSGDCSYCGERFIRYRHGQRYCSARHRQEAADRRAAASGLSSLGRQLVSLGNPA